MRNSGRPILATFVVVYLIFSSGMQLLSFFLAYMLSSPGASRGLMIIPLLQGETFILAAFWSLVFLILGIGLLLNSKKGYFLALTAIPIRLISGLALYGFSPLQVVWILLFVVLIIPEISAFYRRPVGE